MKDKEFHYALFSIVAVVAIVAIFSSIQGTTKVVSDTADRSALGGLAVETSKQKTVLATTSEPLDSTPPEIREFSVLSDDSSVSGIVVTADKETGMKMMTIDAFLNNVFKGGDEITCGPADECRFDFSFEGRGSWKIVVEAENNADLTKKEEKTVDNSRSSGPSITFFSLNAIANGVRVSATATDSIGMAQVGFSVYKDNNLVANPDRSCSGNECTFERDFKYGAGNYKVDFRAENKNGFSSSESGSVIS